MCTGCDPRDQIDSELIVLLGNLSQTEEPDQRAATELSENGADTESVELPHPKLPKLDADDETGIKHNAAELESAESGSGTEEQRQPLEFSGNWMFVAATVALAGTALFMYRRK